MDIEKLESMLKQIKVLNDKLEIKKLRGNNDYNLFLSLLDINDEVRLHSRFIYSLLDPNSLHYQKELFLELFIKACGLENFGLDPQSAKVYKEYENIDIYITDDTKHIILENKLNAGDQEAQIKRYIKTVQKENSGEAEIYVLFLSPDKHEPSNYSLDGLKISKSKILDEYSNEVAKFKAISYDKEIMEWLDSCLDEAGNLANLAAVISQYKNVIEKIYGTYKGVEMDAKKIREIILENYDLVDNIRNRYFDMANIHKINTFMPNVKTELKKMLSQDQWCIEVRDAKTTKRLFSPISFYKYSWDGVINFRLEFDSGNFLNPYIGLAYDTKRIKKEYVDNIQVESLSNEWKVGERFARYKMLNKTQFLREIIINKYTEAELAEEFVKMKDKLESLADEIIKLAIV
ncbi:PD-(D/E)XK nuclease family protein [Campylobacter concisus]|uniref:PDDEXK-like family protein n=1 Tax=Campylobacter concisus TaxID=199 RepID=UPI000D31EDE0|nr:PD-(D/E)XK nuclease family protein [Campylobacter concisus]